MHGSSTRASAVTATEQDWRQTAPPSEHAANMEEERRFSKADLEHLSVTERGAAYSVENDRETIADGEDFVLVVTGFSNPSASWLESEQRWYRPRGMTEDEFYQSMRIHVELYHIANEDRVGDFVRMKTYDDPVEEAKFTPAVLKSFRRKPLEATNEANTYMPA